MKVQIFWWGFFCTVVTILFSLLFIFGCNYSVSHYMATLLLLTLCKFEGRRVETKIILAQPSFVGDH